MSSIALSHPLPLPRGWPRRVRSAVVQVISLARASLAVTRDCLISSHLQPLRCLCNRWDTYPAQTTSTGAGFSPAELTSLYSRRTWTTSAITVFMLGTQRKGGAAAPPRKTPVVPKSKCHERIGGNDPHRHTVELRREAVGLGILPGLQVNHDCGFGRIRLGRSDSHADHPGSGEEIGLVRLFHATREIRIPIGGMGPRGNGGRRVNG